MAILHPIQRKLLAYLKKNTIEGKTLRDIAEDVGVDHPYKISHHLEQLQKKGYLRMNPTNPTDYQILKEPAEDVAYLNVYSQNAQCGPEGLFAEEYVTDRIPLSTEQFGIANSADYFLVKARGDSMEPKIKEGDYVLAQRAEDLPNNSVAIVTHKGVVKIKKYWKDSDDHVLLLSLNENYPPEVVKEEDGLKPAGVVKNIVKIEKV